MDKLQAMEVFVQVVDTGSFTRAAENLQIPKSTVSILVRGLETALSTKLLNRTTRQISVTSDGAAYYERCLSILADVRDAEESLSASRASPTGRLRVDVSTGFARHFLLPRLHEFFARYPGIDLDLGCSDRPVNLIEEGVDCAVRGGELSDSTLIARRVGVMRFITVATPSYLSLHGTPTHPDDLHHHQCLKYFSAKTGKTFEWDFARDGQRIQMKVPGRLAVNDANAYMTALLNGMGIAQMVAFVVQPYIASGRLERVLKDWCVDPMPVQVVYPQNRHLSAKVRAFVEWMAEQFDSTPGLRMRDAGECPGLQDAPAYATVDEPPTTIEMPSEIFVKAGK